MAYSELFCQSNFSFLQGASHPEELVVQAHFLGYQAIAITDECSVAGVVRAHTAIKEHNLAIKLIVGSMFRLGKTLQVVLLCPCRKAYAELCRVITNARRRGNKGKYNLQEWDLMSLKYCLIIWLPSEHTSDQHWGEWLKKYHHSRLWLGVQRRLLNNDRSYIQHCTTLSQNFNLPITACGGVLFHHANRQALQHILTAIKARTTVETLGYEKLSNAERSLRSIPKLTKLFNKQWLDETLLLSARCHFNLQTLCYEYPTELVPSNKKPMDYLRELVNHGIKKRFPEGINQGIQNTIDKELALIEALNYPYYFLTIHDIVMFAMREGILFQGRGSAANSIVCYCLGITSVDPRQINVLFERFISKERDEPPDIDVDFEHERREEVIQYIYQKYGRERTAIAATVVTYRLKSAIREVGKALGIHITQLEFFIKNINRRDSGLDWQSQLIELGLQPDSLKGQQFIELVNEIKGFPRHLSQHVGGFVISAGPLYELVPVENASMEERTVIQWDKDDLESLGLLKVDVLALGMLSAIRKCFTLIKKHNQRELSIADITRKKDDPNVYNMIQKADTVGLFQIESRAQMSMLPRLKPKNYYDLVIQIAIVRPGPIQGEMVHPFLKRRDGIEPIEYPSEEVKAVLSRTLGVPIFQEQVIKLAMVAAGFTGGEADQLRRAMASWKKNGKLLPFKAKLINGMQAKGYDTAFAEQIFNQILGFGEYGFPESHSASFAVLAYVSAWLKYYYPALFYTALLNSLPMGFYSASQLIQDAKRHNIVVLPVCINHSDYDHCIVDYQHNKAIRLGLRIIKGFSKQAADVLLKHRPLKGFTMINELKRLNINRYAIEQLASADAFHTMSDNRYTARWQIMDSEGEMPLFANQTPSTQETFNFVPDELASLKEDYASIGLTLNKHPITLMDEAGKLKAFTRMAELTTKQHKALVTVAGVVTGKQAPGTASGVTFMTLEDDTGNINVVVWSATSRSQKQAYMTARMLMVKGVLERDGDVIHVIAGKLIDLTHELTHLNITSRDFH
ncbi:error-prone DNA polymerase [Thalassotalea sediminis]|uniref:error-prone DNA polymerase n=1 Tax=Thalassotalea sediminis TaxID=1759089 RepID=UPI0025739D3D|nr:error-prone DNA polymerase [Thalassotalea sediminis]